MLLVLYLGKEIYRMCASKVITMCISSFYYAECAAISYVYDSTNTISNTAIVDSDTLVLIVKLIGDFFYLNVEVDVCICFILNLGTEVCVGTY